MNNRSKDYYKIFRIIASIVALIMVTVTFAGCIVFGGGGVIYTPANLEESKTDTVMYKPDAYHYAGQMAVCWEDRIYYVSDESGQDGLHSMNLDGTDVRFEFSLPKITRLIVTHEAFYYVGVYLIEDKNDQYFALFEKPYDQNEAFQLPMVNQYNKSVFDAYIAEDGTIAVMETQNLGSSIPQSEELLFYPDNRTKPDDEQKYFNGYYIDETNKLVYQASAYENMEDATVVDSVVGTQVMSSRQVDDSGYCKLLYANEDYLFFSKDNALVLLARGTNETEKEIVVENTNDKMKIDWLFRFNKGFLAILKQYKSNNDQLYYIDIQSGESQFITKLSDKVLIDARDGEVLFAQGNFIRCQAADENGMGEMIYEIKMPGNVVAGNVFEIAGDWLFVHKRALNAGTDTHQLQYKVNLKTSEVVDVR